MQDVYFVLEQCDVQVPCKYIAREVRVSPSPAELNNLHKYRYENTRVESTSNLRSYDTILF